MLLVWCSNGGLGQIAGHPDSQRIGLFQYAKPDVLDWTPWTAKGHSPGWGLTETQPVHQPSLHECPRIGLSAPFAGGVTDM